MRRLRYVCLEGSSKEAQLQMAGGGVQWEASSRGRVTVYTPPLVAGCCYG